MEQGLPHSPSGDDSRRRPSDFELGPELDASELAREVRSGRVLHVPIASGGIGDVFGVRSSDVAGLDPSPEAVARARVRNPRGEYQQGSLTRIPWDDGAFEHVVCSRLPSRVEREDVPAALAECRRVARRVALTVRFETQEGTGERLQAEGDLLRSLGGWMLDWRRVLARSAAASVEMWSVRPVSWRDVESQFPRRLLGRLGTIRRLAAEWSPRLGVPTPAIGRTCAVDCRYWSHLEIGEFLRHAALVDPPMITSQAPRRVDRPMVAFETKGKYGLIDGRRRSNLWQNQPGWYPVLVIRC